MHARACTTLPLATLRRAARGIGARLQLPCFCRKQQRAVLRRRVSVLAVCATVCVAVRAPAALGADLDPVGVWRCVVYGHPELGDERVLLRLDADGATALARLADSGVESWERLSRWQIRRGRLGFDDFRTGRDFSAELERTRLGGTWRTATELGGWWCGRADERISTTIDGRDLGEPLGLMPPLVPVRLSMPAYPRSAVREAREGRVVACFTVRSDGSISDAEIIEMSDDVFGPPTLAALGASTYRGWDDARVERPGCRTFRYVLDER